MTPTYKLVVIDRKAKNLKGLPMQEARDADLVVGKDNRVLKDRYGIEGEKLSDKLLAEVKENAGEVRER